VRRSSKPTGGGSSSARRSVCRSSVSSAITLSSSTTALLSLVASSSSSTRRESSRTSLVGMEMPARNTGTGYRAALASDSCRAAEADADPGGRSAEELDSRPCDEGDGRNKGRPRYLVRQRPEKPGDWTSTRRWRRTVDDSALAPRQIASRRYMLELPQTPQCGVSNVNARISDDPHGPRRHPRRRQAVLARDWASSSPDT
jgi:hypothetical protein